MEAYGTKVTWISADEEIEQYERPGFIHCCQYGSITIEKNEIGAIGVQGGNPKLHPSGVWVIPVRITERIFVVEPA